MRRREHTLAVDNGGTRGWREDGSEEDDAAELGFGEDGSVEDDAAARGESPWCWG